VTGALSKSGNVKGKIVKETRDKKKNGRNIEVRKMETGGVKSNIKRFFN